MNPITKLFRRTPAAEKGIMLEIQSGFTAFSGTAYGNAAYRAAVDAIARHAAKLKAHSDDAAVERLLTESPNAYMSAYDLLYKTATAYFTANNAFLLIDRSGSGIAAFYPLTPQSVEFIGASTGSVFVKMTFSALLRRHMQTLRCCCTNLKRKVNTMKKTQTAQEYAIEQLYEQLLFMKSGIQQAQESGNMKDYLSIMRVYAPALKEYVKLCKANAVEAQTDALIDFVNGGV